MPGGRVACRTATAASGSFNVRCASAAIDGSSQRGLRASRSRTSSNRRASNRAPKRRRDAADARGSSRKASSLAAIALSVRPMW